MTVMLNIIYWRTNKCRKHHCFIWEMRMLLKVYRKIWNCLAHTYTHIHIYAMHYTRWAVLYILYDSKHFMILRLHNNLILKNFSRSVLQQNVRASIIEIFLVFVQFKCSCDPKECLQIIIMYWFIRTMFATKVKRRLILMEIQKCFPNNFIFFSTIGSYINHYFAMKLITPSAPKLLSK